MNQHGNTSSGAARAVSSSHPKELVGFEDVDIVRESLVTEPDASGRPRVLVLAVDGTGFPVGWMRWQDAVVHVVTGRIARQIGSVEFEIRGGHCRRTGKRSAVRVSSIVTLHGRNPLAWQSCTPILTNSGLFVRDRYICAYCEQIFKDRQLSRDHVIPISRGGKDVWTNCLTACRRCNTRKGSKTPEEAHMLPVYLPYTPSYQESLILMNRRILADQMQFLAAQLPKNSRMHMSPLV